MNKIFYIVCLAVFIAASSAKKSATEQAAETVGQMKDKVVETVGFISLVHSRVLARLSFTLQVKDATNAAYKAASPKVAEGAEYVKDKANEAYDALKPKVAEGAE